MKKIIGTLFISVVLATMLSAMGQDENKNNTTPVIFKLASTQSPEMRSLKALQRMADDVAVKTNRKVVVQIYPSSQLGDQRDYMEGIQMGTVEMCLIATGAIESFDPHFAIYGVPGLFHTSEQIHAFYNTPISQKVCDTFLKEHGVRTLGLYDEGIRNVWLVNKQVHKLEDFKGIKLRVPEVPVYVKMFEALNCNPTPLTWGELYSGLQTGIVEGLENNVEMVVTSNLTDMIKYEIKTEHVYSTLLLMINENALNRLDTETKKIFLECIAAGNDDAWKQFTEGQKQAYQTAAARGVKTITLSIEERKRVDDKLMRVTRDTLKNLFPDSIYAEIANLKK